LTVTNVYKLPVWSKTDCKNLFLSIEIIGFYLQLVFIQKRYAVLNASGAAALTGRRNVRGLSKADCRVGRETFSLYYCMDGVELGLRLNDSPNCETETANRTPVRVT